MAATANALPPVPRKLWEHPNPNGTAMYRFKEKINQKYGLNLQTYRDLHAWSIADSSRLTFWHEVWKTHPLIHSGRYTKVLDPPNARMDELGHWFRGTQLNFAENVLYSPFPSNPSQRCTIGKEDNKVAAVEVREGMSEIRDITWGELRRRTARLANAMRARGVKKGDRVALVASNSVDTLTVFLATTSVGALFSSSSTDMGTKGVLDRCLQIRPKWIFMDDWTLYNEKTIDLRPKMREIVEGMKDVEEFAGMVSQRRFAEAADVGSIPKTMSWDRFLEAGEGREGLVFEQCEFRDPFLIVYSSGTTGIPKCIVHSIGGVLVNSKKDGELHGERGPDSVMLQFTTTGWIMYMSSVLVLVSGARAIIYDGSPFKPDLTTFIRLTGEQRVTNLGISPRYLHELQKGNIVPKQVADLSALRKLSCTGMVLPDSLFEWVYDVAFPPHVHLANIAGGTDLAGCFGINNPLEPVHMGGCQGPGLGMKVEVFDQLVEGGKGVKGKAVEDGTPGELVCTRSFPNQPVFFWGDNGGKRYFDAYYARFDNVWTHGDFIMYHPTTLQMLFLGRADGVLNPSGVRFGSADIYNVIETFFPQVADSICVGQRRPYDADESVMLFLMMQPGQKFTQTLVDEVREKITVECSKRHVPKWVFETPDIPTTVNLKKVELPVKQIVSGQVVKPSGTLLNPQSLDYYYQFAKVEELVKAQPAVKSRL